MMVSDGTRIHEQVLLALDSEPALQGHEIGIAARDGVVTLSGVVGTDAERRAAERTAASVADVAVIVDNLRTREFDSADPNDTDVAHAIARLLRARADRCRHLTARIEHGRVTLEGEVALFTEKMGLERRVGAIRGVREVINQITVIPPELVSDIGSRLDAAFREERVADDEGPSPSSPASHGSRPRLGPHEDQQG